MAILRLVAASLVSSLIALQIAQCNSFSPSPRSMVTIHTSSFHSLSRSSRVPSYVLPLYAAPDASSVAQGLGYLVAAGSSSLYTPIALRLVRQKSAEGLTLSTWWIKLASYTCSDVYAFTHGYPLSAWAETLVITIEAVLILLLVSYYQKSMNVKFLGAVFGFCACSILLADSSPDIIALGQASSATLNVVALLPQFALNAKLRTAGDYSPITAALASAGCLIRLFTTVQLADSDPLLLGSYGIALLLNSSLLAQILWYGVQVEGRGLASVLTADLSSSSSEPAKQS